MVTPLPTNPDTIVVASAASGVAPFDLAATFAIVVASVASREHAATVEDVS
jgi:hypothetical protein